MQSYEIGYRGVLGKKLLLDVYYYYSKYKDFIARQAVARGASGNVETSVAELSNPFTSTNYSFVTNSPTPVEATGWGASAGYNFYKSYMINANVFSDVLRNVPEGLVTFFNTPKIRYNLGVANPNLYKNFGFNVQYKWQDKINWQGTFGTGTIPAYGTLDAQVSYKFTEPRIMLKLGGTNLTNNYYRSAFGNPYIGGLYYVSIGYNVF